MDNKEQLATLETFSNSNLSCIKGADLIGVKVGLFLFLDLACKASGKELEQPVLKFVLEEFLELYSHENINDIIQALKVTARKKIFGHITISDLTESMVEVLEERAIERERFNIEQKKQWE